MKIKDFENVRIGYQVMYDGKIYKVDDINRRTHEAKLDNSWIRCSEFEPYSDTCKKGSRKKRKLYKDFRVVCIDDEGNETMFDSTLECERETGIPYTLVDYYLRTGKKYAKRGLRFCRRKID